MKIGDKIVCVADTFPLSSFEIKCNDIYNKI
jgi:hypothetical protein